MSNNIIVGTKETDMNIQKIFDNNKDWVATKLALDPNYFNDLSEGQNPEILYIGIDGNKSWRCLRAPQHCQYGQ
jgi:hypothetical protein